MIRVLSPCGSEKFAPKISRNPNLPETLTEKETFGAEGGNFKFLLPEPPNKDIPALTFSPPYHPVTVRKHCSCQESALPVRDLREDNVLQGIEWASK